MYALNTLHLNGNGVNILETLKVQGDKADHERGGQMQQVKCLGLEIFQKWMIGKSFRNMQCFMCEGGMYGDVSLASQINKFKFFFQNFSLAEQ